MLTAINTYDKITIVTKKEVFTMSILIAYNLEKYRKLNKLTQRQLSINLEKVSKSSIALYEKNQRTPSTEVQEQICNTLNIEIDVLNGKNEINFYTNTIRNELLKYNLTFNEYQYLYKQFYNLFNNSYYFSTNTKMDYETLIRTQKYLLNSLKEMIHNISNSYIGDSERLTLLTKITYNILNVFLALAFTLKNREKDYYSYDVIDTNRFLKECLDEEFLNIFIELKPIYIQILEVLNSLYDFQNNSIPVYYDNLDKIVDHITIQPDFKEKKSILYAIKITDDFMNPRYEKEDIIITKQCENYTTGQYVAVVNAKNNIFIGKLKMENDLVVLQPLNLNYTPILLNKNTCKFIGKIIEVRYKDN